MGFSLCSGIGLDIFNFEGYVNYKFVVLAKPR